MIMLCFLCTPRDKLVSLKSKLEYVEMGSGISRLCRPVVWGTSYNKIFSSLEKIPKELKVESFSKEALASNVTTQIRGLGNKVIILGGV